MFERFTERARQVVVLAQDEARALGHGYIGTEHLLLGLIRVEEGLASRVLRGLGAEAEDVRERVRAISSQGDKRPIGLIPFTSRAKKAIEFALREALGLRHNYIGAEHLLLGLVRLEDGPAAEILGRLDIDAQKVRDAIIAALTRRARE